MPVYAGIKRHWIYAITTDIYETMPTMEVFFILYPLSFGKYKQASRYVRGIINVLFVKIACTDYLCPIIMEIIVKMYIVCKIY